MNLRHYRKEAGLSQPQLSEQSGVSQSQISHLEVARRSPDRMALEDVRAIVACINKAGVSCTVDDVFPKAENEVA